MTDRGTVNDWLEPTIPLRLRGPSGGEVGVQAVVDTGYTGSLTMSVGLATSLGLRPRAGGRATLADGTVKRYLTFQAEVFWGGSWVTVEVAAVGGEVLLGMSLLAGRGLWVEAINSGAVEVRPLAATQANTRV